VNYDLEVQTKYSGGTRENCDFGFFKTQKLKKKKKIEPRRWFNLLRDLWFSEVNFPIFDYIVEKYRVQQM